MKKLTKAKEKEMLHKVWAELNSKQAKKNSRKNSVKRMPVRGYYVSSMEKAEQALIEIKTAWNIQDAKIFPVIWNARVNKFWVGNEASYNHEMEMYINRNNRKPRKSIKK